MPDIWTVAAVAAKFLVLTGLIAGAGTQLYRLTLWPAHLSADRYLRRLTLVLIIVGVVGTLAGFLVGCAQLTGDAAGMFDAEIRGLLWDTSLGTTVWMRLLGAALLVLGALSTGRLQFSGLAGALLIIPSFAATGHVADADAWLLNAALAVHLVGAAMWIGALMPLRRLLAAGGDRLADAAAAAQAFGSLAVVFVPVLLAAGVFLGWYLTGSIAALVGTGYGQFLLSKTGLVGVLLALAACNRLRWTPALLEGVSGAAQRFKRFVEFEIAAVILILAVTAVLTTAVGPT